MIIPIDYKGITIETRLRCDFFVEEQLVPPLVELKAVEGIKPLFGAQLLTYMKLLGVENPKGCCIISMCLIYTMTVKKLMSMKAIGI